jgi:hypothetical protein
MTRWLILALGLAGCGGEPAPPPSTSLTAPLPGAEDLPSFGDAQQDGEAAPSAAHLVTESTTPTTEGIRVPPPEMYRSTGPLNEHLGQGWATHDGHRAVVVRKRSEERYELELIDVEGNILAVLPFDGYPEGGWWSPRWSRSGRFLALGQLHGDLLDVDSYDVFTAQRSELARLAKGFAWSNATDLGVISYWPEASAPYQQPQFHFFRPDLHRTWCPLEPEETVGWVFTGFSAHGDVLYREHHKSDVGEFEWDPVGERSERLRPMPPPPVQAGAPAVEPIPDDLSDFL